MTVLHPQLPQQPCNGFRIHEACKRCPGRHIDPSGAGGSDSRLNVIATQMQRPRRERFSARMFVERVGHCAPGETSFNIRSE